MGDSAGRITFLMVCLVFMLVGTVSAVTALYDEQSGLTFTGTFTAIVYNVSAVAQSAVSGTGPAYLINGYSNKGYWYQIGLSYDWVTNSSNSHYNGFRANYEVFAPNGTDIYPGNSAGGVSETYGTVNPGDRVELGLYINTTTNTVKMLLYDPTTKASFSTSYSAFGATEFVGNPSSAFSSSGFFTGLMTEWYNVDPTFGNQLEVWYHEYGNVQESAWQWVDEYYCSDGWQCNTKKTIFINSTAQPVYTSSASVFSSDGFANEYYNYGEDFLTGVAPSSSTATTSTAPTTTACGNYGPIGITGLENVTGTSGVPISITPIISYGFGLKTYEVFLDNNLTYTNTSYADNMTLPITVGAGRFFYYVRVIDICGNAGSSSTFSITVPYPSSTSTVAPSTTTQPITSIASSNSNQPKSISSSSLMMAIGILVIIAVAIAYLVLKRKPVSKTNNGRFCPYCGAKNAKDSRFCKKCGKRL